MLNLLRSLYMEQISNRATIGVGANEDPYKNIEKARALLSQTHTLLKSSYFEETLPIGPIQNQPNFINGAWLIETRMDLDQLNLHLKSIEELLGRDRTKPKDGPRPIDLDIIAWNGVIIDENYYIRPFLQRMLETLH